MVVTGDQSCETDKHEHYKPAPRAGRLTWKLLSRLNIYAWQELSIVAQLLLCPCPSGVPTRLLLWQSVCVTAYFDLFALQAS